VRSALSAVEFLCRRSAARRGLGLPLWGVKVAQVANHQGFAKIVIFPRFSVDKSRLLSNFHRVNARHGGSVRRRGPEEAKTEWQSRRACRQAGPGSLHRGGAPRPHCGRLSCLCVEESFHPWNPKNPWFSSGGRRSAALCPPVRSLNFELI
jgi:hypothetical protein